MLFGCVGAALFLRCLGVDSAAARELAQFIEVVDVAGMFFDLFGVE